MSRRLRALKIPYQKRLQIIRLRREGHSIRTVAVKAGVSETLVRRVLYRLGHDPIVRPTWKGSLRALLAHKARNDMGAHDNEAQNEQAPGNP